MNARRHVLLALISIFVSMGASYRTTNFVVHAPNQQIAQQVGKLAEHYRCEKAIEWLGYEMQPWSQPCPLYVQVSMGGPSGATSFNFGRDAYGRGMVMGQRMEIQGPLDRLLASVLPHEITHTVFAYHFKQPVPRWADEGGSVLSEDDIERIRHDKLVRQILNGNQQIRLRTLFGLTEYPRGKVMHLYAQGYSMSNYLVSRSDRQTFLNFVAHGMQHGWDNAAWRFYQHRSVEDMEQAWLKDLRDTKGQPHMQVASNRRALPRQSTGSGTIVRLTVPTTIEQDRSPVIRGQSPSEYPNQRYGSRPTFLPTSSREASPRYLPDYNVRPARRGWEAVAPAQSFQQAQEPIPVRLGPPEYIPASAVGQSAAPQQRSPVGFPR